MDKGDVERIKILDMFAKELQKQGFGTEVVVIGSMSLYYKLSNEHKLNLCRGVNGLDLLCTPKAYAYLCESAESVLKGIGISNCVGKYFRHGMRVVRFECEIEDVVLVGEIGFKVDNLTQIGTVQVPESPLVLCDNYAAITDMVVGPHSKKMYARVKDLQDICAYTELYEFDSLEFLKRFKQYPVDIKEGYSYHYLDGLVSTFYVEDIDEIRNQALGFIQPMLNMVNSKESHNYRWNPKRRKWEKQV